MGTIDEIIKVLDDKLLEMGKPYLTLSQANSELVKKGLMSISDKSNYEFKKLLEKRLIPNSSQTDTKPKQWRIFLSEDGEKRKKTVKKKSIPKPKTNHYQSFNSNQTICPRCRINLTIPNEIINEDYIQCLNCGKNFRNPLNNKQNSHNADSINLTKTQRNWIIGIVVVVILIIIGNLSDNDSSSSSSTVYYVNTTTYVATSKSSFDEMFRYINDGDNQALSTLMAYGNVQVLSAGTKVNLISSHFSYCIVRRQGSTNSLYVVTEHITKD